MVNGRSRPLSSVRPSRATAMCFSASEFTTNREKMLCSERYSLAPAYPISFLTSFLPSSHIRYISHFPFSSFCLAFSFSPRLCNYSPVSLLFSPSVLPFNHSFIHLSASSPSQASAFFLLHDFSMRENKQTNKQTNE